MSENMKIVWNEQSVRWFRDASEYTGYHKKLAEILLEYIPSRTSLCDVGCGTGLIDLELAPCFERITCVDISKEAIAAVEQRSRELGRNNLSAVCKDACELEGEWETVTSLFFGGDDVVSKYFRLAKGQMILVVHGTREGNFGPKGHKVSKKFDVESVKGHLDEQGMKYSLREVELEYGQPLRSREDAQAFVTAYSMPMDQKELDVYLQGCLKMTGNDVFPYYLPNKKKLGIFVLRRDENADFI